MTLKERALKLAPAQVAQLRERAQQSMEKLGPSAEAAELFGLLVRLEPNNGLAWFNLGESLRSIGSLREAEEALLTARDLAPKTQRFVVDARLGMLVSKSGSPAEAEKWFRLATSNSECPGWVWILRASNLTRKGSNKLARECLKAAKRAGEVDLEEVLLNEALIDRSEGYYQEAELHAEDALKLDPNYKSAKELLASLQGASEAKAYVADLLGARSPPDEK